MSSENSKPEMTGQEDTYSQSEVGADPETSTSNLAKAKALKDEGNQVFLASQWTEAVGLYKEALALLPDRPESLKLERQDPDSDADASDSEERETEEKHANEDDTEVKQLRATLYANIGAAEIKAEQWKEAVDACTEALRDDPNYEKALHRRATANEKLDTWSSLSSALEDWQKLQQITSSDLIKKQASSAVKRLPPQVEKRKEKETAEMLGKLKDLGNSFLGRFGLSTDNFKFTPNESGGYGMSFQQ